MKRRPRRSPLPRRRWRTVTCSTAWERDEVRLAAVGSCVRCMFPRASACRTWGRRAAPGKGGFAGSPPCPMGARWLTSLALMAEISVMPATWTVPPASSRSCRQPSEGFSRSRIISL